MAYTSVNMAVLFALSSMKMPSGQYGKHL